MLSPVHRIIFDTDSAVFNDDAAALAMLLGRPDRVEILGITRGGGQPSRCPRAPSTCSTCWSWPALPTFRCTWAPGLPSSTRRSGRPARKPAGGRSRSGAPSTPVPAVRNRRTGDALRPFAPGPPTPRRTSHRDRGPTPRRGHAGGRRAVDEPGPRPAAAIPAFAGRLRSLVFMGGNARVPGNVTPAAEFNFWFDSRGRGRGPGSRESPRCRDVRPRHHQPRTAAPARCSNAWSPPTRR